jgi:hypothetical protein
MATFGFAGPRLVAAERGFFQFSAVCLVPAFIIVRNCMTDNNLCK